ncbi:hypothetical protein LARI1_G008847, partial [Lachnellula arida]
MSTPPPTTAPTTTTSGALSPEEAESLKQRLSAIRKDEPFDLVLSGSPEHLEALRQAHTHHESRREALRERHGSAYDEFESVRSELDALGSELHMLTDHSVSLDANFSKYGYSAHLRTYDDTSGGSSETSSPTVRQYFHKGLLWRASENTDVASFELFVDLLYVGIIAINGDHAAESPTGYELLRFSITFIMSWKIWSDLALIISWFETDDIMQRLFVLFVMSCLLGLTTNMLDFFNHTYSPLVSFYLAARLFMATYYFFLSFIIPMVRGMMYLNVLMTLIPAALWISSTHIPMPLRLAPIWIALALDLVGLVSASLLMRSKRAFPRSVEAWIDRAFEFIPALNIEHKVERINAFVTLVFGYSVVAIIYQSAAPFGLNAYYGKAALGLIQAFCFNWIYFELDGADLFAHAIRRSAGACEFSSSIPLADWPGYPPSSRIVHVLTREAMLWTTAHLPFIMSFVLGAAALSKLVIAHDCQDAEVGYLTEAYMAKSEGEIPIGLRWFYCAGLGIALLCMAIISLSHIHKDGPRGMRIRKKHRMANRFCVCVILLCLPTAHGLNSLHLIAIVTGLVVWVLLLELWGCSCPGESFFGEKRRCAYTATARCREGARR